MATPPSGLLERERELARLHALARAAFIGRGRLALIAGEPGIGKTALLRAFTASVGHEQVRVVSVRGIAQEQGFAFGVARRLMGEPPGEATGSLEVTLERHFAKLRALAGRGPVVVAVDDLHFVDAESLRLLLYALNRAARMPFFLLGTVSRVPAPPAIGALLDALTADGDIVEPRPLSLAAVAAIVTRWTRHAVEPALGDAARAVSGGNPFLIGELAKALAQRRVPPATASVAEVERLVPDGVATAVAVRGATLPMAAHTVAAALAVLAEPADLRTISALTELEPGVVERQLDLLADHRFLGSERPATFAHPMLRVAVYQALKPSERASWHRRAARVLRDQPLADDERVAGHLLACEPAEDPAAATTLLAAGRAAVRRGVTDLAADYYWRALAEPVSQSDLPVALRELGDVESGRGNDAAALDVLERAMQVSSDPVERADIAGLLCVAMANLGRPGEAARLLGQVLSALPPSETERGLRLEAKLAWLDDLTPDTGVRTLRRERRFAGGRGRPRSHGDRLALANDADREMNVGTAGEAVDLALLALDEGGLLHEEGLSFPFYATAMILYYCGDLASARDALRSGVDRAIELGTSSGVVMAEGFLAGPLVRQGELRRGAALARRALATLPLGSVPAVYLTAFVVEALRELGETADAEAVLAARGFAERIPASSSSLLLLGERSRLRLLAGDARGALADARDLTRRMASLGMRSSVPRPPGLDESLALRALGRPEEAVGRIGEVVAGARQFGSPLGAGTALAASGSITRSREQLEEAARLLAEIGAEAELARARVWLGEVLFESGELAGADTAFSAALRGARLIGAGPLETAAATGLRRLGRTTRDLPRPRTGALTDTEKRVASAASEGATNAEVARVLGISPRTVETHLARVYRKLDIAGRRFLAAALSGE